MSKEKDKASSRTQVNAIAMISLSVSIVVFFFNDYMGARSGVDQSHLNNFTLVVLFVSGITSIFLLVKKRAIVLTTISLLVALGLFIYTLISMSIRITF